MPGPASSEGERPAPNPAIRVRFSAKPNNMYCWKRIFTPVAIKLRDSSSKFYKKNLHKKSNNPIYWRKKSGFFNNPLSERECSLNKSNLWNMGFQEVDSWPYYLLRNTIKTNITTNTAIYTIPAYSLT